MARDTPYCQGKIQPLLIITFFSENKWPDPATQDFATYNFDDLKPIPHPGIQPQCRNSRKVQRLLEESRVESSAVAKSHSGTWLFRLTDPQVFSMLISSIFTSLSYTQSHIYFGAGD